jgi:hypothetical protein
MELKRGPSGGYTLDQWVITENVDNDTKGTFSYRYRYLGERQWQQGDDHHDEMLRRVAREDDFKMMLEARAQELADAVRAGETSDLGALKLDIHRNGDGHWVYLIAEKDKSILKTVKPGRPGVTDEIVRQVLDAAMEAAAILEDRLRGVETSVETSAEPAEAKPAVPTTIVCVGCGDESKLKCGACNAEYGSDTDVCPACGAAKEFTPADSDKAPEPVLMTPSEAVRKERGYGGKPPANVQKPVNLPPPPPMDTKPMPMHCGARPDASATVHRLMAALAPALPAHAIAAAVLNLCECNGLDPQEFVDDLRGTLKRCAEEWGANRG